MSLFPRQERRDFGNDTDWVPLGGATVSESKANGLAPYFAAIRHLVDYPATLPLDFHRADGEARHPTGVPSLFTVLDEPGGIGQEAWVGQFFYGLLTHGNAVGWKKRADAYGYPTEVIWLGRSDWSYDDLNKQWRVWGEPVGSSRIVHVPWIVPPGKKLGLSPLEHFGSLVGAGLSAQAYADVKRGGGIPPSVLKNTAKKLQPGEAETVRDRVMAAFASGKPFVTGSDWDLTLTTIPPNHAQFIETLKLTANQIAAIFGIDPREIGGTANESLTYTNDESRALNRAHNARPYLVRFERAMSRLLPGRQFVKFNIDATIRSDVKTRTDIAVAEITNGISSVNEYRARTDRKPVTGGDFFNVPAPKSEPTSRTGETP